MAKSGLLEPVFRSCKGDTPKPVALMGVHTCSHLGRKSLVLARALGRATGHCVTSANLCQHTPTPTWDFPARCMPFSPGGEEAQPGVGVQGLELLRGWTEPGSQLASPLCSSPWSWKPMSPSRAGDTSPMDLDLLSFCVLCNLPLESATKSFAGLMPTIRARISRWDLWPRLLGSVVGSAASASRLAWEGGTEHCRCPGTATASEPWNQCR